MTLLTPGHPFSNAQIVPGHRVIIRGRTDRSSGLYYCPRCRESQFTIERLQSSQKRLLEKYEGAQCQPSP
jgi:hypothetical protein